MPGPQTKQLEQLVKNALQNADENGYTAELKAMSFWQQASDMRDGDSDVGKFSMGDIIKTIATIRLEEDPVDTLNKLQAAGAEHPLLDPVHAIQFTLSTDEGLEFLRCWNEGDWAGCATNWPEWLTFKS
ncbi:hypothetical protein C3Y94_026005 [Rhizobium ruizarguesonis]|uniref:hypothetical protein n=1 Tax=Rhizobium ruizarguesonis TaxID=2081791 RepID=UPI00163B1BFD|nr:hypothetical protein [Rhizobium ruizarguesonis]MBC2806609.1 hypothetical protein [Rhizobium ruizarguesonis]